MEYQNIPLVSSYFCMGRYDKSIMHLDYIRSDFYADIHKRLAS